MTAIYDPSSVTFEELEVDPFPYLKWMRANHPVSADGPTGGWLVTSWEDCVALGSHPSVRAGHTNDDAFFGTPNILRIEGDEHKGQRAGIDAQLRPRVVNSYVDPMARPIIVDYIERIKARGSADLTTELFELISVRVVGDLLGLPDVSDETLVRWFHTLSEGMGGGDDPRGTAAKKSLDEINAYMRDKIELLRREPDRSIIAHMLHGGIPEGAEPRGFDDVMGSIRVIILGGFQEPGHAIANTFLGLLTNPDQYETVLSDPGRYIGPALHESLRWIAPIGMVARQAVEDFEYKGHTIAEGDLIEIAVCSANRDESRYEHPDDYDLHRMLHPNASFGYGEHYCAGHSLARGIGQIAIEETIARLPGLRLDPTRQPTVGGYAFRGAKELPAVWDV